MILLLEILWVYFCMQVFFAYFSPPYMGYLRRVTHAISSVSIIHFYLFILFFEGRLPHALTMKYNSYSCRSLCSSFSFN